jgi:hypothetical protein
MLSTANLLLTSVAIAATWFIYRALFHVQSGVSGARLPTWVSLEIGIVSIIFKSHGLALKIL